MTPNSWYFFCQYCGAGFARVKRQPVLEHCRQDCAHVPPPPGHLLRRGEDNGGDRSPRRVRRRVAVEDPITCTQQPVSETVGAPQGAGDLSATGSPDLSHRGDNASNAPIGVHRSPASQPDTALSTRVSNSDMLPWWQALLEAPIVELDHIATEPSESDEVRIVRLGNL